MPLTQGQGLAVGQVLQNRYRIVALLGQGGMGAVYRAWDLRLERPVALKEMVPQPGLDAETLAQLRSQFRQEAVVLGKLKHPHLVPVSDFFDEAGNDYLVMEFVEGESLAARIGRDGALPEDVVVAWAGQLLGALAYCHRRGVIHRDIKPQNVVLTPEGDAVLVDFGLVKLWDPADPNTRTVVRGVGTPEYAPPEQWGELGQHTDARSDLYSLGATLYHALTGQAPPTASYRMVYPRQFKTPRELNGRVSPHVDAAITRAMTLAIDDRWPAAADMARELVTPTEALTAPPPRVVPTPTGTTVLPATTPGLAMAFGAELGPAPSRGASQPAATTPRPLARAEALRGAVEARHSRKTWRWVFGAGAAIALAAWGFSALPRQAPEAPRLTEPEPLIATAAVTPQPQVTTIVEPVAATAETTAEPTAAPEAPVEILPSEGHEAGSTVLRDIDGMRMVYVPAGPFEMGSDAGEANERPAHEVTLDAFFIDETEVTNEQYGYCVTSGVCHPSEAAGDSRYNGFDQPVIGVSWDDAMDYCGWVGARLPTEAEWEKAARGPANSVTTFTYPWGSERLRRYANCDEDVCEDGYEFTSPVDSFPGGWSWVGARDMAGNAWEWVFDWYSEATYAVTIAASDVVNPEGPTSGTLKVVRGGNFQFDWDGIRTTARTGYNPNARDLVGFRCVVDLTNPAAPAVPPASQPVSEPPALGSTAVRVADGAEMLFVPEGTFAMGAADAYHDEAPVHEVTLDAFWIDKTEVTNAQWKLCVDAGPCNDAAYGSAESINGDAYPVAGVSWSQAAAYCAWAGARLPTEAEWEYVARGPESLLYPWGDDLEQGLANCAESDCADGFEEASPVGSFPGGASWVGAVDMAGNGWEWVNDWYNEWYYDGSPERNPPGPVAGTYKVIRGGAWSYNAYALRTSYRYSIAPEVANPDWAFRCAADRPITSSAFDWVVDGAAVAFWATGVGWLDGRTRDGTVGVAPQIEGYTGTQWRVHLLETDVIALECLGDQEGPRWLDCGTEAGGPVGLSPTTEGRPGTRWSVAFFDRAFENRLEGQELVTRVATTSLLRCLGPTSGPRLLAVGGPDGEVRLAEESTSWAVVQ